MPDISTGKGKEGEAEVAALYMELSNAELTASVLDERLSKFEKHLDELLIALEKEPLSNSQLEQPPT